MASYTSIQQILTYYDNKIKTKMAADILDASTAINNKIGTVTSGKTVVQMISDAQTAATYDDTALAGRVTTAESAINTLNGNASTNGSVAKQIADAINTFSTQVTDNNTIDTFKELVDYVAEHGSDFSALVGRVETAEGDIDNLETLVGEIPSGATATDVVGYAAEVAASEASDAQSTAESYADTLVGTIPAGSSATDAIGYAAEVAASEAATAESNANSYTDTAVGTIPNGSSATDAIGYAAEVAAAAQAAAESTAASDATSKANAAEGNANTYTDNKFTNLITMTDAQIDALFA